MWITIVDKIFSLPLFFHYAFAHCIPCPASYPQYRQYDNMVLFSARGEPTWKKI